MVHICSLLNTCTCLSSKKSPNFSHYKLQTPCLTKSESLKEKDRSCPPPVSISEGVGVAETETEVKDAASALVTILDTEMVSCLKELELCIQTQQMRTLDIEAEKGLPCDSLRHDIWRDLDAVSDQRPTSMSSISADNAPVPAVRETVLLSNILEA